MFALFAFLGALAALVSVATTRRLARTRPDPGRFERRSWAAYLLVAALIYVAFAALGGAAGTWLALELGGVALYGGIALAGARRSFRLVGLGWLAHALWDLVLHPAGHPGYVPAWYPPLCLGFDVAAGLWPFVADRPGQPSPLRSVP
ncbi:MAG: DUF6010 family protein [Myxococcota bacterium]